MYKLLIGGVPISRYNEIADLLRQLGIVVGNKPDPLKSTEYLGGDVDVIVSVDQHNQVGFDWDNKTAWKFYEEQGYLEVWFLDEILQEVKDERD